MSGVLQGPWPQGAIPHLTASEPEAGSVNASAEGALSGSIEETWGHPILPTQMAS